DRRPSEYSTPAASRRPSPPWRCASHRASSATPIRREDRWLSLRRCALALHLGAGHAPRAGDHGILVHIEAGTVGIEDFHDDISSKSTAGLELPQEEL